MLESLASFGLNDKASRVYIALLEKGEMGAIALSKHISLHRQFVYNALNALKEKGLVLEIGETRRVWRAQTPRKFIALAEEQELKANRLAEELLGLTEEKAGQEFAVTEGTSAFRQRILDTIRKTPHESTVRMICGQWRRYFDLAGEGAHMQWDKIRIAKRIAFRIIGPTSLKQSMDEAAATRALTEYRTLGGLEENLVNTVIYDELVDFDIYGEPHLTFSIKNPEVAQSQKHFFEVLWDLSSK